MTSLTSSLHLAALDTPTIILLIAAFILLFGGSKLPELARGFGKARREFRKASDEVDEQIRDAIEEDERKAARAKIAEEEERKRIRAKIEAEERAKIEAEKKSSEQA